MLGKCYYSRCAATILVLAGTWVSSAMAEPAPLPWTHLGSIDRTGFREPSGICFHPSRGTLFVVGDEGDLAEWRTDGTPLRSRHPGKADFEGITCDPDSGWLYVAVEGDDTLLEFDPDTLTERRRFRLPRRFQGRPVLPEGGQGIEAVTFAPNAAHPQGGTFFVTNQAGRLDDPSDRSLVLEVELPLKQGDPAADVRILRLIEPGLVDLAGLHYRPETGTLLVVSDKTDTLLEITREGTRLHAWRLPGKDQEGIAVDADGFLYLAQDSGGVLKLRPDGR